MKIPEMIKFTIVTVVVVFILTISLRSCSDRADTPLKEQDDPAAVTHYVDGYYINEVHPKPGVTCFVFRTEGISCIKE